jgi:hypothetical protein
MGSVPAVEDLLRRVGRDPETVRPGRFGGPELKIGRTGADMEPGVPSEPGPRNREGPAVLHGALFDQRALGAERVLDDVAGRRRASPDRPNPLQIDPVPFETGAELGREPLSQPGEQPDRGPPSGRHAREVRRGAAELDPGSGDRDGPVGAGEPADSQHPVHVDVPRHGEVSGRSCPRGRHASARVGAPRWIIPSLRTGGPLMGSRDSGGAGRCS